MSSIIQPDYGTRAYSPPSKVRETKQARIQGSSFFGMAARICEREMQLFKQEFYQDLSKIAGHPTVNNAAVNISDAAFQAMKDDPEYRSQVLSLLQRDLGASYAPRSCSVLITVGTNLDQYRADSWPVGNDSEFRLRSKDSFYKKTSESKDCQKELLEEYQEKKLQVNSFPDMAAQAGQSRTDTLTTGMSGLMGMVGLPTSLMMDLSVRSATQIRTEGVEATEAPSLETMLKAKYPNIHYHVFDASSGYWRTRNDYPHYLLYQDGDKAKETLENWQPTGANPFYGSIDGRFIAPTEIHALGSVPPGSKAVVIHPKVQERMEQDPAYAQEIFAKIDTWFAFDVARNEAIMPGSTWDMSQAVAIGEDGNICNACSSSGGGEITYSKSGSDDGESWWDLRVARHAEFMKLVAEKQLQRHMQDSDLLSASVAKSRLASMIKNGNLQAIFGDEITGIPTETILALTQAQVWGGRAML